jgi:hypothetical protein
LVRIPLAILAVGLCAVGCGETAAPASTPSETATATPDASRNPNQPNAYVYNQLIQEDMPPLVAAAQSAQGACSAGDLARCRAGLVAVQAAATQFQGDDVWLNGLPDCLKPVDLELSLALTGLIHGSGLGIAGIDNSNSGTMNEGTAEIQSATGHLSKFTTLLSSVSC